MTKRLGKRGILRAFLDLAPLNFPIGGVGYCSFFYGSKRRSLEKLCETLVGKLFFWWETFLFLLKNEFVVLSSIEVSNEILTRKCYDTCSKAKWYLFGLFKAWQYSRLLWLCAVFIASSYAQQRTGSKGYNHS